jgi:hypothetical protein
MAISNIEQEYYETKNLSTQPSVKIFNCVLSIPGSDIATEFAHIIYYAPAHRI